MIKNFLAAPPPVPTPPRNVGTHQAREEGCRSWLLSWTGSPLLGEWSEPQKIFGEGAVAALLTGANTIFALFAVTSDWDPINKGCLTGIGVLASGLCAIWARTCWDRLNAWQDETTCVVRYLEATANYWRVQAELFGYEDNWSWDDFPEIGSGNSGVPSVAPRGQLCRHPLGAEEGQVIRGPWEGAQS